MDHVAVFSCKGVWELSFCQMGTGLLKTVWSNQDSLLKGAHCSPEEFMIQLAGKEARRGLWINN